MRKKHIFTKKHYIVLADYFSRLTDTEVKLHILQKLVELLSEDNPSFKPDEFRKASYRL